MFVFAGFCEGFDFFVEDDVADVVFWYFGELDQGGHDFYFSGVAVLFLELLDDYFQELLLLVFIWFGLEVFFWGGDHWGGEVVLEQPDFF